MKRSIIRLFIVVISLFVGISGVGAQDLNSKLFPTVSRVNRSANTNASPTGGRESAFDRLVAKAQETGPLMVIIGFRVKDYQPEGYLSAGDKTKQRAEIGRVQSSLLARLSNYDVTDEKRFDFIPFMAFTASAAALTYLRGLPDVTSIQENEMNYPMLPQSIPILGGSPFGGATGGTFGGFSGAGRTVAILDTGVDKSHPFFNNRVVSEACYSTNSATTTSFCPGGASSSTAPGSGVPCTGVSTCTHGTHVAGIAAGGSPLVSGGNGVAKNATIIAVQVFSRSTSCGGGSSPCTTSITGDTIAGLERVYALRTTYAIDSVNMSLGGGRYFNNCDTEQAGYKAIIDTLRSAGIATIIASGNDSYTDSIASPACVSTGVSVGSTNDGDSFPIDFVSSFSNAAIMLNLLAPGELILSSVPGGSYDNQQGTSMAAPMVAGAWAVMKEKFPADTVSQTLTRFRYSGVQVLDSRQGLVVPRIKIDAALNASSVDPCATTFPITPGQQVNGAFTTADCLLQGGQRTDMYTFTGTQGQGVAITETAGFFTYLFLQAPSGSVIGQNGGGTTSRIPAGTGFLTLPATGTYRIYATTVEGNRLGNYTLNLTTNGCSFTVSSSSASVAASAGTGNFNVTTGSGCTWTAQSDAAWLTTTSTGNGNGAVNYNFTANTGAQRTGTITVGGQTHTVTQAAGCSFGVSSGTASVAAAAGSSNFNVTTTAGCTWTAQSDAAWLTTSSTGNGNGTVNYNFTANTGAQRTGTITVGGQTHTVTQAAGCSFGVSSSSASVGTAAGSGNFNVTTAAGCTWTAQSNAAWLTTSSTGNGNGAVTYNFTANTGALRTGTITVGGQTHTVTQAPATTTVARSPFDFDGDRKTDISIFRPGPGEWWWLRSSTGANAAVQFGASTDKIVASDFTGDTKTDIAFWRPSTGQWFVLRSEDFSFFAFPFGANGDIPVPADYDADGKADAAVFRPSSVTWFISKSTGGTQITTFGAAGDLPVNADFDGDGKSDVAIYRPNGANGAEWWIQRSSNGSVFATQFGTATDKAVAGDYTGDGKVDVAFWRPSNGNWFILRSEDFSFFAFPFGANSDVPIPGDYDGDGKQDAAVFRPTTSTWFLNRSTAGTLIQAFGAPGDLPLPNAFVR